MAVEDSPPSSKVLQRDYDKTLTKDERQAVITDLQSATAKKEGESDTEGAAKPEARIRRKHQLEAGSPGVSGLPLGPFPWFKWDPFRGLIGVGTACVREQRLP